MFSIGDSVVFPSHGAGVIEEISTRDVLGESNEYLRLVLVRGDMEIMVPAEKGREIGMRPTIDADEIPRVKEAMIDADLNLPKSWPARNRKEQEILESGSAYDLARLIGALSIRDLRKGLPTTERNTLRIAISLLASEFSLVEGTDLDTATEVVQEAREYAAKQSELN